jgi:hypothetical protein
MKKDEEIYVHDDFDSELAQSNRDMNNDEID